jgi:hypothetical protein
MRKVARELNVDTSTVQRVKAAIAIAIVKEAAIAMP